MNVQPLQCCNGLISLLSGLPVTLLSHCSSSIRQHTMLQPEAFPSNLGRSMGTVAGMLGCSPQEPSRTSSKCHQSIGIWRTPLTLALPPTHIAAS